MALVVGCSAVLALGACGNSKPTVTTDPTTTVTTATTTTTVGASTTTVGTCASTPTPTGPVTAIGASASLLTNVSEVGGPCVDDVVFDFTAKGTDPPGYSVSYGAPPFVQDGSGAPVTVAGNAFVVVKVRPGYGYDFEAGKPTYTGPKSVAVTAGGHVTAIVETGDFEGVLTWIIGLDARRPFRVAATGTPKHRLVVTIG